MEWLTWALGQVVRSDQPDKEENGITAAHTTLLDEIANHFQQPIYICSPETKVVRYWLHLGDQLFARKGLGVASDTYAVSRTDVDRAVLKGVTETNKRWKVEIRRDDTAEFKFRYLANVQVGDDRLSDQIVLGETIKATLAHDPSKHAMAQPGLTRRRRHVELDATAPDGAFDA
ncbi:hypothetical protein pqer_cds_524 [Pandoravirus quercus]|uniref:Uncharacterized protein n=1 Tax=Pandoravirus quercus TaxID=2107709 RepID=A0A2U7U945_9VIRU|nr:hypothetical protein pqer_cds_524 [Pandoravirus quercus]AVK74946.1 hypothetical protein pqer_cds_524 [Pandoravirus quercus]